LHAGKIENPDPSTLSTALTLPTDFTNTTGTFNKIANLRDSRQINLKGSIVFIVQIIVNLF
jgi:hypothetical protein